MNYNENYWDNKRFTALYTSQEKQMQLWVLNISNRGIIKKNDSWH